MSGFEISEDCRVFGLSNSITNKYLERCNPLRDSKYHGNSKDCDGLKFLTKMCGFFIITGFGALNIS
jgi:hypothetical protein